MISEDYLLEAFENATDLRKDQVEIYIKPLLIKMENEYGELGLLLYLEEEYQKVYEWFINEFAQCDNCEEWTRQSDLVQARYDAFKEVCPSCREDGC